MIATLIGTTVMASLALVAVTAVRGDIPLYSHDLNSKRAYEAARTGVEDYAFHLYANPLYWTAVHRGPAPTPVNQQGSTTNRRKVPGDPTAQYAIELLPATGQTECKTTAPTETHDRDQRHRRPARSGSARPASPAATRNRSSPPSSGRASSTTSTSPSSRPRTRSPTAYPNPSAALTGAYKQCELTYEQGRYDNPIPGTEHEEYVYNSSKRRYEWQTVFDYCNDDLLRHRRQHQRTDAHQRHVRDLRQRRYFGRKASDVIETGAKSPGWFDELRQRQPRTSKAR